MPYLVRRAIYTLLLLFVVSILTFAIIHFSPGDVFDEMRLNPQVSPSTIDGLREQRGLKRSLPARYLRWLESALKGEWGTSLMYNSPAASIIWIRTGNTLLLTGIATAFTWLIALPAGIWSAASRGRWAASLIQAAVALLLAIPEIVLTLLLLVWAVRSHLFPAGGMFSYRVGKPSGWFDSFDLLRHLFLPLVALTLSLLPTVIIHVRAAVAEVLDAPFLLAARAHGISSFRLLVRHALPVASNPLVSLAGLSIGMLLSSSMIVEGIFSWPGLGTLLISSIADRDLDVVVDIVLLAAVLVAAGNLAADAFLRRSDSRIRSSRWLPFSDRV